MYIHMNTTWEEGDMSHFFTFEIIYFKHSKTSVLFIFQYM